MIDNTTSKRFLQVSNYEDNESIRIKIKFHGHKFTREQLQMHIGKENVLIVKAEDVKKKFERKFKLPKNSLVSKISSYLNDTEEDSQILIINIPKK